MLHCPLPLQLHTLPTDPFNWSSSDKLLSVPHVNLKSASQGLFSTDQAPGLWNCCVPIQTQYSPSLTSFKSSLKTHLFCTAFTWDSEISCQSQGAWSGGGGMQSMGLTGEPAAAATFSSAVCVASHCVCVCVWMMCTGVFVCVCVVCVTVWMMCMGVFVCVWGGGGRTCVRLRRCECVGACNLIVGGGVWNALGLMYAFTVCFSDCHDSTCAFLMDCHDSTYWKCNQ